jgi:hypothetical protein
MSYRVSKIASVTTTELPPDYAGKSFHEKAGESQGGLVFTCVDSLPLS